ncbi:carboxymuconolactone decarboxylase family protein [Chimaeribacter arupi]|uniref:Carboxymuconolactone decarboxylase family protein n=2 Tax=Yersiniaceae TaxID=1903411 RepID=A0A2N5EMN1_9GAMM|nr:MULTISPECIES: carboxymuconolactone decarboxylase family protein [Yersiniaceae]MBS0968596.1 carboxymuconolactone decarboxylase family protein [Nissabacter archeti]MDV5139782.1 carboxymuconolactone decarboxylase family protein [Chimaeribacter arupi]PLR33518.1 carboxymuconolactone decarboxylase family protein [Chimaeribacter arupi]PLR46626.1 carboxymuconolactone decarboxylase family protein [Chimaeribacter arupi]PLR49322.1 carboxymuconolactone decarboxylase family protein [Chimaeribacter arupi
MKRVIAAAALSLVLTDFVNADEKRGEVMLKTEPSSLSEADIQAVSPALARFGREAIAEDLWKRRELSVRDRSIVTVAILIARNQPAELKHYVEVALDAGVTPAEVSEIITHLAFYSGWPNAMSAVTVTHAIFQQRGVTAADLPDASPALLPLNQQAEKQRSETVEKNVGPVSPGLVKFTADPLFLDLWQRPALKPRDRSLVTVSALIASGQSAQIGYHLNRAMDNGLTAEEAGEVVAQAAFYAGWPNAFSAAPVVGEVLSAREAD